MKTTIQAPAQVPASEASDELLRLSLSQIFARLQTDEHGLSDAEAASRLERYGPNEPVATAKNTLLVQFLRLFLNPLVLILLCASGISIALGEIVDATIIISIVMLSNILNFAQTYRSQRIVERLRAEVAPTATVLRDGNWRDVPRQQLVPGDIIRLRAGDLVAADARLIEVNDLHVQQAALTGESLPVEKQLDGDAAAPGNLAEIQNGVFLGTSIVSGSGQAVIVATGLHTSFGDIASHLVQRAPETEFERGIRHFGLLIMQTVFFLVIFIVMVGLIGRHPPFETVLFAIALAVGLTPEFLPMITTVTLGQGAMRMAKRKVIVKRLESIQNFGSIDILCSDKTGTITSGETHLDSALGLDERPSPRVFLLGYLNSSYETGFKSPLDAAILAEPAPDVQGYRKLDEIPFDFERRLLSIVVQHEDQALLITKGAPESVLAHCTTYELDGEQHPLESPAGEQYNAATAIYRRLSEQGYRLLAVAHRTLPVRSRYSTADEQQLVLQGFLVFADPIKEDVAQVLQDLRRDGVQVKIISGDNELVTRHVCEQVGLESPRVVLGQEIERMSDTALVQVVEQVNIFARVSPVQKNRIIQALKIRKHVVGYMGDGINDAPSLHTADVGISVASAVDVARDAASIILLEQSLQVLHQGILEGRKAFGNVIKYLLMGTSSNFGNMFSMAGAYVFLPFLPMLATQILLNNFLYDFAQITIPTDNVDAAYVKKPQHWDIGLIRRFMIFIGPISSIFDFLTFFLMLRVFQAGEALFHTGWFVESLATQTLVIFIIRTVGNPFRSRPSIPLTITTVGVVLIGAILPFTPLSRPLGFTPLPPLYFLFLGLMVAVYLFLVQLVKGWLMRNLANHAVRTK
ncbi:magnesium-translocating P-type ATPase [Dictyobacter aurantiacus]|uniref:Magnesium-transporting ATPase, P-type 1 n=1 Tax=Dictyobacter aurantiacus TaxID=1936993 RepID=A0A401ZI55_9CHLR|nr:magnesium-translocating P-type ATPase [Dictyobacter aurantiacus]GCE06529.1 magnesium-translocating P-type ATPase [Dictyobacter aurantiacus]